jgi:hypothetical protein
VATQTLPISTPSLVLNWRRRPRVAHSRRKIDAGAPLLGRFDGALLQRQAQAEASFFVRLVRDGRMTVEQAEDVISVPTECRAALEAFAAAHPGAPAAMVRAALQLRDEALRSFREVVSAE